MRHQGACRIAADLAWVSGFIRVRAKCQTKGQPRRLCPSDQQITTSTSICTGFLRYSVRTRAHANMPLGKARGGPPTPRGPQTRDPNGKLPFPNPGCSGSPREGSIDAKEKASYQCREPPPAAARGPRRWRGGHPGTCPCHGTPETLAARAQGSPEAARCQGVK